MKKYQDLENKVKELQAEIERLKQEEQEDKLPRDFNRDYALKFLKTYSHCDLHGAFAWSDTPQGDAYWRHIIYRPLRDNPKYVVSDKVIIQIQKWVILSYQNN